MFSLTFDRMLCSFSYNPCIRYLSSTSVLNGSYPGKWPRIPVEKFRNMTDEDIEKFKLLNVTKESSPLEKAKYLSKWRLIKAGIDIKRLEYTIEPLPFHRHGGRGPDGRMWFKKVGGGRRQVFHWVQSVRARSSFPEEYEERVDKIMKDDVHSAFIALVSGVQMRRWIFATDGMKPGQIIKTSKLLSAIPVRPINGNAYPLASLPIGTTVCQIELRPGHGASIATAAGTRGIVGSKVDGTCTVRMPSKRSVIVSEKCIAVVGMMSNLEYNKIPIGSATEARRLGIRPSSGLFQRKTGRFGRKIKPIKKPLLVCDGKQKIEKICMW